MWDITPQAVSLRRPQNHPPVGLADSPASRDGSDTPPTTPAATVNSLRRR